EAASERARLADHVSETTAALERARQDHESAAADVERLTQREADLNAQLADLQAARHHERLQHDAAIAATTADLANRQNRFERELTEAAAKHARLVEQLHETSTALDRTRQDHESAVAHIDRLTQRVTDLTSQVADVEAVRSRVEAELGDASTALQR